MSTIVTRAGKGSPLTWNEVDNNFTNLNNDKLQSGNTAAALTITSATINGGTITGTALNGTLGATTPSTVAATNLTSSGIFSILAGVGTSNIAPSGGSDGIIINYRGNLARFGTLNSSTSSYGGDAILAVQSNNASFAVLAEMKPAGSANGFQVLTDVTGLQTSLSLKSSAGTQLLLANATGLAVTGTLTGVTDLTTTGNTILGNASTDTLNVGNGDLIKDASGNLGIGTASPTSFSSLARNLVVNAATNSGITISESTGGGAASLLFAATPAFPNKANITNDFTSNSLQFGLNGTERMRLDASGNLGLGVAPSAWNSSGWIEASGFLGNSASGYFGCNAYYNGGWKYKTTGTTGLYTCLAGVHGWSIAPSGTAGNPITFTQAMTLDASGNLGIGTTSPLSIGAGYKSITTNGTDGSGYFLNANTTSIGLIFCDIGFMYAGTQGAYPLVFRTNATERMRIHASGGLSLGNTTDPGATNLSVTGTIKSTGYYGSIGNQSGVYPTVASGNYIGSNFSSGGSEMSFINSATTPTSSFTFFQQTGASSSVQVLTITSNGFGYGAGSGGAVTQITSRTTGVTLNKSNGAITLFTAAGATTAATFTVTNSTVAATDVIHVCQKSGSNLYNTLVTAVAAGSFNITFFTTGGVISDAPVFNFTVIKAVTA